MSLFDCRFKYFSKCKSSKLNFRYVGSLIVLYWEGHNSSIRNEIEVNEHLIESLFDKLSNRSSSTSISHRLGFQIVIIFYRCFCQELLYHHGHVFYPLDPSPSGSTSQGEEEATKGALGRPPPWPPSEKVSKVLHAKSEAQSISCSSPSHSPGPPCSKTDAQNTSGLRF